MERINAYENLRGIVYTPFYLGLAEGLFEAAGVDLQATLSPSGEETIAGAAAGRVDVAWGGPMRVMREHDRDSAANVVCFGLAVGRDPFMVIGRQPEPDFSPARLIGRRLLVGTAAPTPWLLLQEDIRRLGCDPADVDREDPVDPTAALERLAAGDADYVLAFEPWPTLAERAGQGVVVSAGAPRGPLAFTSFYAPRPFLEARPAAAKALMAGLAASLTRLRSADAANVAAAVQPWFQELDPAVLAAAIARYRRLDLWPSSPTLTADGFVRLKSALLSGGFIAGDPPFERLAVNL